MIPRRTPREIEAMRAAGKIVGGVLKMIAERALPGVTTAELDREAETYVRDFKATPLFKGYRLGERTPFPATICASVNEEVVHGIPGPRALNEGDILSLDVGVRLESFCADAAVTAPVGRVSPEAEQLIAACREALDLAIAAARVGNRLSDVSRAVQECARRHGCAVVKDYTGHGIGRRMHEEPQVPNFVSPHMADVVLFEGIAMAIEPMLNAGGSRVRELANGWTVVTADGSLSAHFEHTVAITAKGPEILTLA